MSTATAAAASWKNPRILRKAITRWAERDDTRPDPKATAAAEEALAAIDATIAELAALRGRLVREMSGAGADAEDHAGEQADAEINCDADWGSATESQRCILPDGHAELHKDRIGYQWGYGEFRTPRGDGQPVTAEPPAPRPGSPEVRLLRAIYGLCPACDRTDEHVHDAGQAPEPEWTDDELAALPPMFSGMPRGPWPYSRAA